MKLKLFALLLGVVLLAGSCDEQEFGFNVSKEVNLGVPVTYETVDIPLITFNPPPTEQRLVLSEVGAFSDALEDVQDLGEVLLNSMAYEITDVSNAEETPLDDLRISVEAGNQVIDLIVLTGTLTDVNKTDIPLTADQRRLIVEELSANGNDLNILVNLDFAEAPSEDINMNINVFFDITLKIRQNLN